MPLCCIAPRVKGEHHGGQAENGGVAPPAGFKAPLGEERVTPALRHPAEAPAAQHHGPPSDASADVRAVEAPSQPAEQQQPRRGDGPAPYPRRDAGSLVQHTAQPAVLGQRGAVTQQLRSDPLPGSAPGAQAVTSESTPTPPSTSPSTRQQDQEPHQQHREQGPSTTAAASTPPAPHHHPPDQHHHHLPPSTPPADGGGGAAAAHAFRPQGSLQGRLPTVFAVPTPPSPEPSPRPLPPPAPDLHDFCQLPVFSAQVQVALGRTCTVPCCRVSPASSASPPVAAALSSGAPCASVGVRRPLALR